MKHSRIPVLLLSVILCIGLLLTSCGGSGMSDDEIREIYRDLTEKSYPLNEIYYGEGLPYQYNESVMAYLTGIQEGTDGFRVSYMPVSAEAAYKSEAEIRTATAEVFSDSMCSYLYAVGFEGMSTAEDETVSFARYIEQDGILTVRVDLAEEALPMGRTFDFDNMTVIADEGSVIRASFPSYVDGEKSVDVKITIVNTANGWRLDSPTY